MPTLYFVIDDETDSPISHGFFGQMFFEKKAAAEKVAEEKEKSVPDDAEGFTVYKAKPAE